MFSVTGMAMGVPTGAPLALSVALSVMVAFAPPACRPLNETATLVVAEAVRLTVPLAGVVVSQLPPLTLAVQLRALAQAPLAVMVTFCAAGGCPPATPLKESAPGEAAMAQEALTTKVTATTCGPPGRGCPLPSVPLTVMVPL